MKYMKCVNGKYVEMTTEEIAEMEKAKAEHEKHEAMRQPTESERLEALEMAMLEMLEVYANG